MRRPSALVFILLFAACSNPLPELAGIDRNVWIEDKKGCAGKRSGMQEALSREKEKLKGLSEMDIVALLGKPDENELYKRNQKFYSYYVTPGPDCAEAEEQPQRLVIRFNAMGYAQLVTLQHHTEQ